MFQEDSIRVNRKRTFGARFGIFIRGASLRMQMAPCEHFQQATILTTDIHECAECIAMDSRWVHLRLCLYCGHVGCCDSSPNQHASKHVRTGGHPVVRSIEPGETWAYCYEDDAYVEDLAVTS